MREFVAQTVPKLQENSDVAVELNCQHGAKPLIEVDGKKFKTKYDKLPNIVKDLGKRLGTNLD
jgi:hypothetical protein